MRFAAAGLLAFALAAIPALAQNSFPMVTHVTPVAVQIGTTAEVTVEGQQNFAGAYKVLVEGTGVTAEVAGLGEAVGVPKVDPKAKTKPKVETNPSAIRSVKLKITVAANATPGVREFRVAAAQGISSLGQIVVTPDPVVVEKPGINEAAKAQLVPVPSVVCGRIEIAENVDFYKFAAKSGQVLTFEVFCARIEDKIHDLQKHADPLIAVYDTEGRELAASDDAYFADPVLTFPVPKDGEYLVQIRDAKYDGDPRWVYALAITDAPYAAVTYPMAANPGQTLKVEPVGSAKLAAPQLSVTAPSMLGIQAVRIPVGGSTLTNPVPLVVTPFPMVNETEPNDDPKQATRFSLPGGANGRIQTKRDLDHFVFKGEKGKAIRLEVFARRFGSVLRSQVDAVLDVMTPDGSKALGSSDDVNGKDPLLIFTPTADGDYVVRIRDLNNKGGPGYVYYLEADYTRPSFDLKCDPSIALISPGSSTAWYVQVTRANGFEGPVKVEVAGLPKGVTVNPLTIPANMKEGCLILTAAADTAMTASPVQLIGTADAKETGGKLVSLSRTATPMEEIYSPGGGRARFEVGMPAVSVTAPGDLLEVKVSTNKVTLKPGEEVKIDVTVKRRDGFDKGVNLDVLFRHLGQMFGNPLPPGVTLVEAKSKTLLGTGNVGSIVLKAAPDAAECTNVPICIQGYVSVNFVVKIGYGSAPILISVKK